MRVGMGGYPSSAPSSLNFGVEPLQFHAGVFYAELPATPILSLEGALGCPDYEKVSGKNRAAFPNREAAKQAGYQPARKCQ